MRHISASAAQIHLRRAAVILVLGLLMIAYIPDAAAQARASSRPTRIRFMSGAISAHVRGQLMKNRGEAFYVVKAKAGDHMIVNIISTTPGFETGGEVTAPSGASDGQHGGIIFNSDLTETGDFQIRVTLNLMAGLRHSGSFILEVVITPSYIRSNHSRILPGNN
jgi:hypothetical protein